MMGGTPEYSHIRQVWANGRSQNPSSDAHHIDVLPGSYGDEADSIERNWDDSNFAAHSKVDVYNLKDAGCSSPFALSL